MRVLLVTDHADTALMLARLFALAGHDAHAAGSGAQAMDLCEQGSFDVLICDLGLSDGDPIGLLVELRGRCAGRRAIAISGSRMIADVKGSRAAGFDGHLGSPIEYARVVETVGQLNRARGSP
jgi:two-component system CheB/CheR fusion protein